MNVNLAFAACCAGDRRRAWMLEESANYYGIELNLLGLGRPFTQDLIATKVSPLLDLIPQLCAKGFTHVLYLDGMDSFFTRGKEEIIAAYTELGEPSWLVSYDSQCWPYRELAELIPPAQRFPNTGAYMGSLNEIEDGWKSFERKYGAERDEEGWLLRAAVDGTKRFEIDSDRRIFRGEAGNDWVPGGKECALHFNGGYFDPETGREWKMLEAFEKWRRAR